jgi:hypothetical protein
VLYRAGIGRRRYAIEVSGKGHTAITGAGTVGRRNVYSKSSDLSDKRAGLLRLQALDCRRIKLLSEVSTMSEQMSVLKTKIADLASFRQ